MNAVEFQQLHKMVCRKYLDCKKCNMIDFCTLKPHEYNEETIKSAITILTEHKNGEWGNNV